MMVTQGRPDRVVVPGPDDGSPTPAVPPGREIAAVEPAAVLRQDAWREQLAAQLLEQAKAEGMQLVGPDGLLAGITKAVLETALATELAEHLGYEPGEAPLGAVVKA